jgi:hypothetical protein
LAERELLPVWAGFCGDPTDVGIRCHPIQIGPKCGFHAKHYLFSQLRWHMVASLEAGRLGVNRLERLRVT